MTHEIADRIGPETALHPDPHSPCWRRPLAANARSVVLIMLVLLASALRFAWLGRHSLWADEAFVAWAIRFDWRDLLHGLASSDLHPPLSYLITKAWSSVAGTSETALRIPSACLGVASVILTYGLARHVVSPLVSVLSAGLVAVSPFQIMAAQEVRMYPLLTTLTLGTSLALIEAVRRPSLWWWLTYGMLATFMTYTHYFGFLVLLAHGTWIAWVECRHLRHWLQALAVVALLNLPWTYASATRIGHVALSGAAHSIVPPLSLQTVLALLAFGGSISGPAYFDTQLPQTFAQSTLLVAVAAILVWGLASAWPQTNRVGLIGLTLAVTPGLCALISLSKPLFYPRVFSFLAPLVSILIAQGVVRIARCVRHYRYAVGASLVTALLALNVSILQRYYFDPNAWPFHWRAASEWVTRDARGGDFLLYVGRESKNCFAYYFHPVYPSQTLLLRSDSHPALTPATARRLANQYGRLWVVISAPFSPAHPLVRGQLISVLNTAFREVAGRDFNHTWVFLLAPRSPTHI